MKTKDLIIAGAFAALYVVVLMVCVSVLGVVPILFLMAPFILAVILGPVYMLYVMKVPKPGAILLLAVIAGFITSLAGMWFALVWSFAVGLIAQLIVRLGKYQSKTMYRISYCVFACTNMGPFWMLILAKKSFLTACVNYYGPEYAANLNALTPGWILFVLVGITILGGLAGGALGSSLLGKHFEKAGVV